MHERIIDELIDDLMDEYDAWHRKDLFADWVLDGNGVEIDEFDQTPLDLEVISRFPRYSRSLTALPAAEREKIEWTARFVVNGLSTGQQSIRTIRLIGHSDMDTPRRPTFEHQIALERARDIGTALSQAINLVGGNGAVPPYSSRLAWEVQSVGAT